MTRADLLVAMMFALISAGCANKPASGQETLDRKFEEMMKGVTLVGRSSSLNSDSISGEEKYVIDGLSKLAGDTWLLRTRLQCCGSSEVPVPLPVTIKIRSSDRDCARSPSHTTVRTVFRIRRLNPAAVTAPQDPMA
jgi:hypothetical protein